MTHTALITGAGRGIGRATALRLAREHHNLLLLARTQAELEETQRLAGLTSTRCQLLPADLADPATPARAVDQALRAFGSLTTLIHCAGHAPLKPITDTTDADLQSVLDINLTGFYRLIRAAWPHLQRNGGGAVIALSSYAARDPFVGFSAYAAAKGALNALIAALHREGRPHHIRAYAIAPGAVETAMLRSIVSAGQLPTTQTLSPEEVANVVFSCLAGPLQHSSGETVYLQK